MFHQDQNDLIYLNRGDSGDIVVELYTGSPVFPDPLEIKENDIIFFGVCEPNCSFEQAIIKKVYTKKDVDESNNHLLIHLNPKDTEYLIPGTYYWSVKIGTQNLEFDIADYVNDRFIDVNTLISSKKFVILR